MFRAGKRIRHRVGDRLHPPSGDDHVAHLRNLTQRHEGPVGSCRARSAGPARGLSRYDAGMTRRKDATATRKALLDAARELFASKGFDRTTVRDIAALAGVNQALLFRYFGSKEELLGRVLAEPGAELLADVAPERLLDELLRRVLAGEHGQDSLLMLALTGPGAAAETLRREVTMPYADTLAGLTTEPDAHLRAELALAWVLGLTLTRNLHGSGALADADPGLARELVLRAIQTLLEGTSSR